VSYSSKADIVLVLALTGFLPHCGDGGEPAAAESTTLTWDAVSDPDLAGYRVYASDSPGTYTQPGVSVGDTTTYEVEGLKRDTTYYFVVTAYDFMGNESSYSNEVSKTTP